MSDEVNEMSDAMRGSRPVGWGAVASDGSVVCMMRRRADVASYVVDGTPIVPLYRQPQPTLTDEEREALRCAVCDYNSMTRMMHKPTHGEIGAALARLFERLK